ncbi:phage tail tube protein [Xanthobacter aminoxidans]|uniref:phage tail tube protein n=1 Tax=Xanthobacter aminoxidans TaxID=186280 RepID=UPI002022BC7E|nr:phage tail tube protein [Xanthobacter aminoxidans]MCL8382055.1 phage tail tube protein [Xanthobacter aminoxidans]
MTESNRVRMTWVDEVTPGTTPNTPRMRAVRYTGETLAYKPNFTNSEEIRDDRMNADPIKVGESNSGPVNTEFSFPVDGTPHSSWLASLFANAWANTPVRDNDGTADSIITQVTASTGVVAVATGAAFAVGHLVRTSGFGTAGNNGLFKITTGSATVPAVGAGLLTDEAAPPAAARMKVVGLQGASGDLVAAADGITSTTLDFTTLGLVVGQWIKVGGTGAAFRFATEGCNGWARIIAIAANKLTLDNLPGTWATDTGTGKTLRVFFGDQLKNGVTKKFGTVERGFMGQSVPTYIVQKGMLANQGEITLDTGAQIKATYTFMGLTGSASTTSLDSSPDAATTNQVMSAAVNVGRISQGGAVVAGPNFVKNMSVSINNNARVIEAIRSDGLVGPVDINLGENSTEVTLNTYFGSSAYYAAFLAGASTNVASVIAKNGQAVVLAVPRMTGTDGNPSAGGKNQDVMVSFKAMASIDPLTNAHVIMDRLEYYEN